MRVTVVVLVLLIAFIYEKAAHTATKEVRDALQVAHDHEKVFMNEVWMFLRGKVVDDETGERAKDICNMKMDVERNMTAMGLCNLGNMMLKDETVTINSTDYNKKECYLKALEIDPLHAFAYLNLGVAMNYDATVHINRTHTKTIKELSTINGINYTRKECFFKTLEIDPRIGLAWYNLGMSMYDDETVTINGTTYTTKECFIGALEIDPRIGNAWFTLGTLMSKAETVTINGNTYTKKECFVKALEIDRSIHLSWVYLVSGDMMMEDETVTINGTEYTKKDCNRKFFEVHPTDKQMLAILERFQKTGEKRTCKEECLAKCQ